MSFGEKGSEIMNIGKKIRAVRESKGGISQEKLAEMIGKKRNYITMLENSPKDKNVELKTLELIAQALGVSVGYITDFPLNNASEEFPEKSKPITESAHLYEKTEDSTLHPVIIIADNMKRGFQPDLPEEQYLAVPMLAETIAAGEPRIPTEEIQDFILIPTRQIGRKRNLVALKVAHHAESMIPTICPGDIVAIDRNDRWLDRIHRNSIYAVQIPSLGVEWGWTLKRVDIVKDLLILGSDNRDHPTRYVPLDDFTEASPLVGRVVWLWRNL